MLGHTRIGGGARLTQTPSVVRQTRFSPPNTTAEMAQYNPDPFAAPPAAGPPPVEEFNVRAAGFRFRVKVGPHIVAVGGEPHPECVQVSPSAAKLIWLRSSREGKPPCELDGKPIRGDATLIMARLALTLLRRAHPAVAQLQFEDASTLDCALPDGRVERINLNTRDALLYGVTYYERAFSAEPQHATDAALMARFRRNRQDPSCKPATFDFVNPDLQRELAPAWAQADTWAAFFHRLHRDHGSRDFCAVIHPWYQAAFAAISGAPVHTPPFFNTLDVWRQPDVPYERLPAVGGGGGWRWPQYPAHSVVHSAEGVLSAPYTPWLRRRPRRHRQTLRHRANTSLTEHK